MEFVSAGNHRSYVSSLTGLQADLGEAQLFNCRVCAINQHFSTGNYGNQVRQSFTQISEQANELSLYKEEAVEVNKEF